MQMLYPLSGSIQQYMERMGSDEEANRCRPASCPQCESKQPLVCHGFYKRTVADVHSDCVIRVRRYLCSACRRTVSLLPEFALPYLRFTIVVIGAFLKARLLLGKTLQEAAETAHQAGMPYQRGQQWVRRFRREAQSVSAALAALVQPIVASDFVNKAIAMLEETGWVAAHRFLFQHLRQHLLGWPDFLAPAGIAVTMPTAVRSNRGSPQSTCMDSKSYRA
jgi:transposase-like protein